MEAAEDGCIEKAECLQREFAGRFKHIYYTVHPRGLPSEMQCKSANEAWAARWIKRRLVDELGYDLDHILVTTMDADTLWHPNHFYALTYLFAINPDRHLRFWQGQIRYHSNVWEISPPMRLLNAYSTALELGYLGGAWWMLMPMSSYSLSLRLLDTSGYWDSDVIADEWHMFVKAFFARNGEVKVERVFLPFLAQATTGDSTDGLDPQPLPANAAPRLGRQRSRLHDCQDARTPGNRVSSRLPPARSAKRTTTFRRARAG